MLVCQSLTFVSVCAVSSVRDVLRLYPYLCLCASVYVRVRALVCLCLLGVHVVVRTSPSLLSNPVRRKTSLAGREVSERKRRGSRAANTWLLRVEL